MKRWFLLHRNSILNVVIFLGIWVLIMMFINFNAKIAENTKVAKETAQSTNKIVKGQDDTLNAIRQLANDTKVTAEQKTNIIICMLKVPVAERTTDTVTFCRKQAESTPSPAPPSSAQNTSQNSTSRSSQNTNSNTNSSGQPGGGGTSIMSRVTNILEAPGRLLGGLLGQ